MKSNLLSIDCGLQKSLHDLTGFKERLVNFDSEPISENICNNQSDIKSAMNEQMLSLKKMVASKQAELEQVLAEKHSMAIRVESLEVLIKEYLHSYCFMLNINLLLKIFQARLKKETNISINVNDTDDGNNCLVNYLIV